MTTTTDAMVDQHALLGPDPALGTRMVEEEGHDRLILEDNQSVDDPATTRILLEF